MKTEAEIRELIDILRNFNPNGVHDGELIALTWVLNEHRPMPQQSEAPPRSVANPPKKEEA